MSKKTVVAQSDLRKLMQKVKTGGTASSSSSSLPKIDPKLRKYKLTVRELQLLEDQRRSKEEKRRAKAEAAEGAKKSLPEGFFDAKPVKSILKNSSSSTYR